MHAMRQLRETGARTVTVVAAVFLLAGCGYGPEKTVTLTISGTADDAQRDEIVEELKTMTDGSGHMIRTSWSGGAMTGRLAPVRDVEAFAERIEFGEVTSIDGREVAVAVRGAGDDQQAVVAARPPAAPRPAPAPQPPPEKVEAPKQDDVDSRPALDPREQRRMERDARHAALIGEPAVPLDVNEWLNGEPLSDEELAGRVVLLDFWAVWCGPCIRTFPHLRRWHEQYADQGLVIVGLTRYYQYDWDEEQQKPQRSPGLSRERERQMLQRFADHHQLPYWLAIMPDRRLTEHYAALGIPQVVLIDREGAVRLIRVGSSPAGAREVEETIRELVGETAESLSEDPQLHESNAGGRP